MPLSDGLFNLDEDPEYNRDAYGTPLGKPYREPRRPCPNCGSHYHLACADDLDPERDREDTEAAHDDDRAKLWPGGYDNL